MQKLCTALLFGLLVCPAMAQTNYNVCFNSLDVDVNGTMSKGEFLVAFSDGETSVFEQADADKNGAVSPQEWANYKESQGFEAGK